MISIRSGQDEVWIPAGDVEVEGTLTIPREPRGFVLFADTIRPGKNGGATRFVAGALEESSLATLRLDLVRGTSGRTAAGGGRRGAPCHDVGRLAVRLVAATDWIDARFRPPDLTVGYFGSGTGAAAAFVAAAARPFLIGAVVSCGGRPDLAAHALPAVRAATLFLAGEKDEVGLELDRRALAPLAGERALVVVPGATHRFEEAGALQRVAALSREWLGHNLGRLLLG